MNCSSTTTPAATGRLGRQLGGLVDGTTKDRQGTADEVLPVVSGTPVLAGGNGRIVHHPPPPRRARTLVRRRATFDVGLFERRMRQAFEETGMSDQLEVDIIRWRNVTCSPTRTASQS